MAPVGAPSYPAHGNSGKYGETRLFNKGVDCKALSRRPFGLCWRLVSLTEGIRFWGARLEEMDGRTEGFTWGAPKPVRPSVWPYPLVERRMDTGPQRRVVPDVRVGKTRGFEICNGMSPFPRA